MRDWRVIVLIFAGGLVSGLVNGPSTSPCWRAMLVASTVSGLVDLRSLEAIAVGARHADRRIAGSQPLQAPRRPAL
ncbi:MAG: hypothetical protein J2P50_16125 [Hyphomicrobiaceae bacterium]|nr:hypothetical protein [Hyphomicrobiaceae bacterium]